MQAGRCLTLRVVTSNCGSVQLAERTITDDLEYLIQRTVNSRRADYAVVTGVQIHSWGTMYGDATPNLEFVCPSTIYAVVAGEKTYLDLAKVPMLSPRQIRALSASAAPAVGEPEVHEHSLQHSSASSHDAGPAGVPFKPLWSWAASDTACTCVYKHTSRQPYSSQATPGFSVVY